VRNRIVQQNKSLLVVYCRDAFRESEDFKNFKLVVRTDSSTTRTKRGEYGFG